MISSLLCIAASQAPTADHWQVSADISRFGPVEMEGTVGPTEQVFRFSVTARPDGSLPLVQSQVGNLYKNQFYTVILKQRPSGKFALHAVLRPQIYRLGKNSGFLLTPGEYAYYALPPSSFPTWMHGCALLSGKWVGTLDQNSYWSVDPTTFPSSFPLSSGGNQFGYRFIVSARPDGKIPAVEQCTSKTDQPERLELYRLNTSTSTYDWWFTVDVRNCKANPIVQLAPGDYAVSSPTGSFWTYTRAFCTILTGRLVEP